MMNLPEKFRTLIITLSDRVAEGEYEDLSGPQVKAMIDEYFNQLEWRNESETIVIPDDKSKLRYLINEKSHDCNIIITTGGTGLGPRDITVDVVKGLLDIEIPGIMDHIRIKYGAEKPNALLSRSVAGIIGKCLIYTLPGSVKAVSEYMTEILKTLQHTIYMQYGIDVHQKH
ncbi:MAG: MogA/MoaB family molybdenum cofactor biosynthesis protein [Bacteroidales bacterium]|nr:MogA/MoaB family molybdenum cofactor biosynthesis protein [Bacteroidales bacterium]